VTKLPDLKWVPVMKLPARDEITGPKKTSKKTEKEVNFGKTFLMKKSS
jgi:hypothetical protein